MHLVLKCSLISFWNLTVQINKSPLHTILFVSVTIHFIPYFKVLQCVIYLNFEFLYLVVYYFQILLIHGLDGYQFTPTSYCGK